MLADLDFTVSGENEASRFTRSIDTRKLVAAIFARHIVGIDV
jgi:hypothetical protein